MFWGGAFSGQPPFAADPINLGTETSSYMDEVEIAALGNVQGMRLSWGATEEPEYFDVAEYKTVLLQQNMLTTIPPLPTKTPET